MPSGGDGDGSTHAGTAADPYAIKKDLPSSNVNAYVTPSTICDTIEITADPPFSTHGILKVGTGTKIIQWESNPSAAAIDAMPAAGLTYEVTITDTGSGAYKTIYVTALKPTIGSKPAPDAVGDIVFTDGSASPYPDFDTVAMSSDQVAGAVAVIYDATNMKGVGLVQGTNLMWAASGTTGYTTFIAALQATKVSGTNLNDEVYSGLVDGSTSLASFRAAVGATEGIFLGDTDYPAWAFVENYATTAGLTGSYASGWYMPSMAEICKLYQAMTTVNAALNKISGAAQLPLGIWSCNTINSGSYVFCATFSDGTSGITFKDVGNPVLVIRAF